MTTMMMALAGRRYGSSTSSRLWMALQMFW